MKKLFTLMTLFMLTLSTWAAKGDIYELIFNGSNVVRLNGTALEDPSVFFTYNKDKHNFNTKFKDCSYAGIDFTKGLKMEGATLVQWTATAESKVTILQSSWSDNTILFDGEALDINTAELIEGGILYKAIENVPAGTHQITRGSGETGLFYVRIDYTGEEKVRLADAEITADKDGLVTIAAVPNAKEVRYTTDGTNPTEETGEIYTAPFKVEDGTTVKALAIGEGNYVNSNITSLLVLVDGITVAAPVINQLNGTVYIKSSTVNSTIEYSLDQQNWQNGDRAFTLSESATVYARAGRANSTTSEVVSAEVKVIAAPTHTEKVYLFYDNPENYTAWMGCNENEMEGNMGTPYADYLMAISGNTSKNWSNGEKIIVPGITFPNLTFDGDSVTSLKVSNGAQNTITLPEGKKAVRITFYSYVNGASTTAKTATGWQEVDGVTYDYASVPMTAFTDQFRTVEIADSVDEEGNPATKQVKDIAGKLDIRVFDFNFKEGSITFTNKGTQVCFVAVLEMATEQTVVDQLVTTINEARTVGRKGVSYNLAGQKVTDAFRGIVIENGKKMMRK